MENQKEKKTFYQNSVIRENAISDLCQKLTSTEILEDNLEKYLVKMGEDFIDVVLNNACINAKHKNSDKVEIEDMVQAIKDNFNISDPSIHTNQLERINTSNIKNNSTSDHKKRLELTKEETKNAAI